MQPSPAELDYSRFYPRVDAALTQALDAVGPSHPAHDPTWTDRIGDAQTRLHADGRLRVALVGEYSAGKSSLIKALTGADVAIDADVATSELGEYDWNGITLVDTPGIQADTIDTDHDDLSRRATLGADLVLFVLTNELFTPRLAEHLSFVTSADGLGLADKTALVVNKIDREQNPDATIVAEIDRSTPGAADLPIWFCATGPYNKIPTVPARLHDRFLGQSRLPALADHIDAFVEERGALGRLLTPLQEAADVLDLAQAALTPSEDDRQRLELLRRKKRILVQLRRDAEAVASSRRKQARAIVLRGANGAAGRVTPDSTPDELTAFFSDAMVAATPDLDANLESFAVEVGDLVAEATKRLRELDESPLGLHVGELDAGRESRHTVEAPDGKPGQGKRLASRLIAEVDPKKALDGAADSLKKLSQDPKGLRDLIYKFGKKHGKNFKPWEPTRMGETLAKWAGRMGKAVPFVFAAVEFVNQVRAEKAEEKRVIYAASARASLRRSFSNEAEEETKRVDAATAVLIGDVVDAAVTEVDEEMTALAQVDDDQRTRAEQITAVKRALSGVRRAMTTAPYA